MSELPPSQDPGLTHSFLKFLGRDTQEFAALFGELYRIQMFEESQNSGDPEDSQNEFCCDSFGTSIDRMVGGMLRVSIEALPFLRPWIEKYHSGNQPGVFVYDHLQSEDNDLRIWSQEHTLSAELRIKLSNNFWFEAAENLRVDTKLLKDVIDEWGEAYVKYLPEAPDWGLTPGALCQRYKSEHPKFSTDQWHDSGSPQRGVGYWEWVLACLNREQEKTSAPVSQHPSREVWVQKVAKGDTDLGFTDWTEAEVTRLQNLPTFSPRFDAKSIAAYHGWRTAATADGEITAVINDAYGISYQGADCWQQAVYHELHHSGYLVDGIRNKFYPVFGD